MIPNRYHFVFGLKPQTKPFHVTYYLALRSCLTVNEPDDITLYYHHMPYGKWWRRIRKHIRLERVALEPCVAEHTYADPELDRYRYAHHADFVRLRQLVAHGGVYADMDTMFVARPPDRLFEQPCVMGREGPLPEEGAPSALCNALIMAEPGSAFCRQWLADMPGVFDGTWSAHSCGYPALLRERMPSAVHVEPSRSFFPYQWTRDDLHALLEESDEADLSGIYSIHLWDHLWASKGRRDFSQRNHREMTARYIRRVHTTYNRLARAYLP